MKRKIHLFAIILLLSFLLSSCHLTAGMKEYYSHKENYVTAVGTIAYIHYNEEKSILYLGFSDLTPRFPDHMFKIVGGNFLTIQENGINEKIHIGKHVEFVSATEYFGDGYVMPIVAISVDGEVLLAFDEGFENFQEWLKAQ